MGIFRLFVSICDALRISPERMVSDSLDKLAATYGSFAYIGNRRTLRDLVLDQARLIWQRTQSLSQDELDRLLEYHRDLREKLARIRFLQAPEDVAELTAREWFGVHWGRFGLH